jgi:hypothetical protein
VLRHLPFLERGDGLLMVAAVEKDPGGGNKKDEKSYSVNFFSLHISYLLKKVHIKAGQ